MRSIRLSLTVYFLGLLAVALAAASVFVYQTAQQTLLSEQKARRQLIETQYTERGKEEEARLDADLLAEAQTLARLAQFQFDWGRLRHRELGSLGVLTAAAGPNAYAAAAALDRPGAARPVLLRVAPPQRRRDHLRRHRRARTGVRQVFSDRQRLGSLVPLPVDGRPLLPARRQRLRPGPGAARRSSPTTTSARTTPCAASSSNRSPALPPRPNTAATRAARIGRIGRRRRPRSCSRARRFASSAPASTRGRDAALAALKEGRDGDLARLDGDTAASLAGLRNRLLLISTAAFLAAVLGCYGLVRLGLSPLRRLSDAVSRVSEKDFRLPLDQRRLPGELKPIAQRLVDTLEMLKRAFAREKQATADISHELRTPLAALLTTTEIALRKPRTAEEYQELLRDCRLSASR